MRMLNNLFIISLGAIFGANTRWIISIAATKIFGPLFPWGTLLVNIAGSFIAGFFIICNTGLGSLDSRWHLLLIIGFCGAFTTFSSFAYETMSYFEQRQWLPFFANFFCNNLLCLGATLGGMMLARTLYDA